MRDDEFEWDDEKAESNRALHLISFEAAREVFRDPFALEWLDERESWDESRYAMIGMVEGRLLYVAFAIRNERVRIISARPAEPRERRHYHEQPD
ncbi:MAG: BrnT family toxin [Caulobacteraceae bacterium]